MPLVHYNGKIDLNGVSMGTQPREAKRLRYHRMSSAFGIRSRDVASWLVDNVGYDLDEWLQIPMLYGRVQEWLKPKWHEHVTQTMYMARVHLYNPHRSMVDPDSGTPFGERGHTPLGSDPYSKLPVVDITQHYELIIPATLIQHTAFMAPAPARMGGDLQDRLDIELPKLKRQKLWFSFPHLDVFPTKL
jgi:hypothetical protein